MNPPADDEHDRTLMISDEMADATTATMLAASSSSIRPLPSTPPRNTTPPLYPHAALEQQQQQQATTDSFSPTKFSWSARRGRRSVAPDDCSSTRTTPSPGMPEICSPIGDDRASMDPVASILLARSDSPYARPIPVHAKPPKVPRPRAIRPVKR